MCVAGNDGWRPAVKNHKWYVIDFVLCRLGNGDLYKIFNLNINTALSFTKLLYSQLEKQLDLLHLLKKCASCYCPSLHLPCPTRQLNTTGSEIRVIYAPLSLLPFFPLTPTPWVIYTRTQTPRIQAPAPSHKWHLYKTQACWNQPETQRGLSAGVRTLGNPPAQLRWRRLKGGWGDANL